VRLRLVAALHDSLFQGELIVAEREFVRVFPAEQGYRVFLIDSPVPDVRLRPEDTSVVSKPETVAGDSGSFQPQAEDPEEADLAALLETRLADYGFDATSAVERLASFHQVENTYLSTFQALGGLGLLLGTIGLATVMFRNVLERRRELALLRAVGFDARDLSLMIVAENALLLALGLVAGAGCAALAIVPALAARGGGPTAMLGALLLAVALAGLVSSMFATMAALRSPLLAALRAE
jgi:ABC-type antimicrobial peptide transport system permease subunit